VQARSAEGTVNEMKTAKFSTIISYSSSLARVPKRKLDSVHTLCCSVILVRVLVHMLSEDINTRRAALMIVNCLLNLNCPDKRS
jgi:hypothetical protein